MKHHNGSGWMPYCGCLLVAAFVKIVVVWLKVFFVVIHTLTRLLWKFVSLHIFMHKNLEMGSLACSLKMEAIFLVFKSIIFVEQKYFVERFQWTINPRLYFICEHSKHHLNFELS